MNFDEPIIINNSKEFSEFKPLDMKTFKDLMKKLKMQETAMMVLQEKF